MSRFFDKIDPAHWIEVRLLAPPPQAEAAADFFYNLTGRGVQIQELGTGGGLWEVTGYLASGAELVAQKAACGRFVQDISTCLPPEHFSLSFDDLPAQNWAEQWKRHFHPREVVNGLVVAPPWEKAIPTEGQRVLVIDPGLAFGTGQHESTVLCLRRIARLARRDLLPARLLDVGCGTGILALSALLFGADSAVALDIDPEATEAALKNAGLNGLGGRLEIHETPLSEVKEKFPLVVANLTAADIVALAGDLAACLAPGGELVASGLLVEHITEVQDALTSKELTFLEQASLAGWASLIMLK